MMQNQFQTHQNLRKPMRIKFFTWISVLIIVLLLSNTARCQENKPVKKQKKRDRSGAVDPQSGKRLQAFS